MFSLTNSTDYFLCLHLKKDIFVNIIIDIIFGPFCFFIVGAGIERLMIQNSDVVADDESAEIFDVAGNKHSDEMPSETVKQMYNASAEEIR